MKRAPVALLLVLLLLLTMTSGCRTTDPAAKFMAEMEHAPAQKRPPHWEQTKSLMARPAPKVGEPAPDFTLRTLDGSQAVTRSAYQAERPLVLIFGSFT